MKKRILPLLIVILLALMPLTGCGVLLQALSSPSGGQGVASPQAAPDSLTLFPNVTDAPAASAQPGGLALLDDDVQQGGLVLFDDDPASTSGIDPDGGAPLDGVDDTAETDEFFALATAAPKPIATPKPTPAPAIDADGSYTSKDDVALYLHTYGRLPENFITKREAQSLGWEGGGLDGYAYGKCIGGDRFGNYEGLLPEQNGRRYTECDIDTLHKRSRGAKRIIFSNDGLIYYTGDHYESFTLLYGEE